MNTENKAKQIVVNVTEQSKAKINSIKETYKISDKEFMLVALTVLENTSEDVIKNIVEVVITEKQRAKNAAKIAKMKEKLTEVESQV